MKPTLHDIASFLRTAGPFAQATVKGEGPPSASRAWATLKAAVELGREPYRWIHGDDPSEEDEPTIEIEYGYPGDMTTVRVGTLVG